MKAIQHFSGSSGNLYEIVSKNGDQLLIECGVQWREILKALKFKTMGISGCLITHEHQDHCMAAKDVLIAGIDLYGSQGTFDGIGVEGRRVWPKRAGEVFRVGSEFEVMAFNVEHDARQPFGYVIRCDCKYILFATDTCVIEPEFDIEFSIIMLECSYDGGVLSHKIKKGIIPESVGKRLIRSHMEQKATISYIENHCNLDRCEEIHLLHISGDNHDKAKSKKLFQEKFFIKTVVK